MSQTNEELTFADLQTRLYAMNKVRQKGIDDQIKLLYADGMDAVSLAAGWGDSEKQIVNNFSKLDRFGTRFVMDNYLRTGYTFITRPELNLQTVNLKQDRIMSLLNTMDPNSLNFGIRCYLDSRFSKIFYEDAYRCPYIDPRNPFFTLLTNNLQDFSGGPSFQLSVHTDEEGYFGESQSIAIGSDSYKKPFDIQMTVVDPAGGPIDAVMQFWTRYIDLVARGSMIMYPDQLRERVINYTVSIYRFIMDPTFQYIRKYAKYTGCFPISYPGAAVFDYNHSDTFVDALRRYSIGFKCASGVVDVDDPIIITEFNTLVERYYPPIRCLRRTSDTTKSYVNRGLVDYDKVDSTLSSNGLVRNPLIPEFNYSGIPYILDTPRGLKLEVIREVNEVDTTKIEMTRDEDSFGYSIKWLRLMNHALRIAQATQGIDEQIDNLISQYDQSRQAQVNQVSYID